MGFTKFGDYNYIYISELLYIEVIKAASSDEQPSGEIVVMAIPQKKNDMHTPAS